MEAEGEEKKRRKTPKSEKKISFQTAYPFDWSYNSLSEAEEYFQRQFPFFRVFRLHFGMRFGIALQLLLPLRKKKTNAVKFTSRNKQFTGARKIFRASFFFLDEQQMNIVRRILSLTSLVVEVHLSLCQNDGSSRIWFIL